MFAIKIKIKLIRLFILEFNITDEGVLSEGFMSGKGLCLEGVMYGGDFVRAPCQKGQQIHLTSYPRYGDISANCKASPLWS